MLLFLLTTAVAGAADPLVLRPQFRVADAPEIALTDHGITAQDVRVRWTVLGPGQSEAPALYVFCDPAYHRRDADERFSRKGLWGASRERPAGYVSPEQDGTPVLVVVDFGSGKAREVFQSTESYSTTPAGPDRVRRKSDANHDLITGWPWDRPVLACAASGRLLLGTVGGHVCSYHPDRQGFRYLGRSAKPLVGLAPGLEGACWALTEEGVLQQFHPTKGPKNLGRISPRATKGLALTADGSGWVYALVEGPSRLLMAGAYDEILGFFEFKPIMVSTNLDGAKLLNEDGKALLIVPGEDNGLPKTDAAAAPAKTEPSASAAASGTSTASKTARRLRLERGRARPAPSETDGTGWQWQADFDAQPPVVQVRKAASDPWRTIPIHYSRAASDTIRTLLVSKDGKTLYGANWPMAWVWRMDLATGRIRREGQDYNWYEMREVDGVVYAAGYFGVKLIRWDPSRPWTADMIEANPGRARAWGARDTNPYFVTNFRFFRYLNVRRPAGLAIDARGRLYTGGHTAAFSSGEETRTSGALFWYDPHADEIGAEPLLHSHVFDVCGVGDYVAIGTAAAPFRYEAPPERPSSGFFLFDTRTQKIARFEDPAGGGSVLFVEEATPGVLVGAGNGGKYGEGAFLFVYDTRRLATTHLIKMSGRFPGSEYQTREMFRRGPDRRIYFYTVLNEGQQKHAVMFRLDATTGKVEAVARGRGISDAGLFVLGPGFAFGPDRVYFASGSNLTSAPLETIVRKEGQP